MPTRKVFDWEFAGGRAERKEGGGSFIYTYNRF
jgi:hypothetical protein